MMYIYIYVENETIIIFIFLTRTNNNTTNKTNNNITNIVNTHTLKMTKITNTSFFRKIYYNCNATEIQMEFLEKKILDTFSSQSAIL